MKNIHNIFISLLLVSNILSASEYVVIGNKNLSPLSKSQIKAIFLKKTKFMNDIKMIPINLNARDPLRLKFENHLLAMNFTRLKSYWAKQHYLGHRPPLSMKSQESVKAFVKKVDGAIGYIETKNLDKSVKVIYRWSN